MVVTQFTATGTASVVLTLSKAAWRLGAALSKLDQDIKFVTTVKNLAEEVKSLGNECDLIYAELEAVVSNDEAGRPPLHDVDGRMWDCLATQVDETGRTLQELELFAKTLRGEQSNSISQVQHQQELEKSKDQITTFRTKICRHADNLRTTLLLINT